MCSINRRHPRNTHTTHATLYHPTPSWSLSGELQRSIKRHAIPPTPPYTTHATLYHPMPSWSLSGDPQLSIKRHPRYHPYHLDTTLGTTLVPLSRLSWCVDHFDLTGIVLPSGTICQLSNMIDCPRPV